MQKSVLIAGMLLVGLYGCSSSPTPTVARPAILAGGTPIDLVLVRSLSAGTSEKGEFVPLLVQEDIESADGRVLIPKGALAEAEVTWSRSEGTLSGLMNQPARLEIKLKSIRAADGSVIPLTCAADKADEPYAFTRENTGKGDAESPQIEALLKDEAQRQVAEKFAGLFEGKEADFSANQADFDRLASQLNLTQTKTLVESKKSDLDRLGRTICDLQKGTALTGDQMSLAFAAVTELANFAGDLGSNLSRTLKGRTIRAHPGTIVRAYVASDATVTPQS